MTRTNEWDNVYTYPDLKTANSLCERMVRDRRRSDSAVVAAVTRKIYQDCGDCSHYGDEEYHYLYLQAQRLNNDKWHKRRGLLLKHLEGSKIIWYWQRGLTSPYHHMLEAHKDYAVKQEAAVRKAKYAAIAPIHF